MHRLHQPDEFRLLELGRGAKLADGLGDGGPAEPPGNRRIGRWAPQEIWRLKARRLAHHAGVAGTELRQAHQAVLQFLK
jgi:hypothetical protein